MDDSPTTGIGPTDNVPPAAILMETLCATLVSQGVAVAATLGIADLLAAGDRGVDALATAAGADPGALGRVLRTLAMKGIFRETIPGRFANTPQSDLLRSDTPGSLRDIARWVGTEAHWDVYGRMTDAVRSGAPQWRAVHGSDLFPFLSQQRPDLGLLFNRAMASFSTTTIPAIVAACDLDGATIVADVGGGSGHLLAAILRRHPTLRGVLFDTPGGLDGAPTLLAEQGMAERVDVVPGDFTQDIPIVADVYLLKHVVHDWNDADAGRILAALRRSMPPQARLLLVEMVIAPGNTPHFGKVCDLDMLVSVGGRERSEEEFRGLLEGAGFSLVRIIPTPSIVSILEAIPQPSRASLTADQPPA